jgi:pimeloyl-ACP methyl ester carboxylesterase
MAGRARGATIARCGRLAGDVDLVAPDLRGFGASDRHDAAPDAYAAAGQAASVLGLIDELALDRPVLVGYDVGSRVAQAVARQRPDAVRALVISPPLPGVGERVRPRTPSASSGTSPSTGSRCRPS